MKLFKSLLVAPATLGLLSPLSAISGEVDFQAISKYSDSEYELDSNSFKNLSTNNTLLSGGEGLVEFDSSDSFSSTTSASFSAEAILGGISTDDTAILTTDPNFHIEAVSLDYQYQIGLTSSFTGEDSLDVTIDVGGSGAVNGTTASSALYGMDATDDALVVDGITYTFPVGGATMLVGDATDVSALYTGACAYTGFSDYIGDCGTASSVGAGGVDFGVAVAASYEFDGGFSLAGGISSPNDELLGEANDTFGIEAAYTADDYGVSVAFADAETATSVGLNGYYTFDFATISAGYESNDLDDDTADDTSTFFAGVTKEVGPGTLEFGYASTDTDPLGLGADDTFYLYEASYAYPVNDTLTIKPGMGVIDVEAGETTFAAVKASFSF
tara:strand:+ start:50 stop:1207 length:1158 start_codon:yes stop_codon:yes gene_type:complete